MMLKNLKEVTDEEFVAPGRAGCPGCGAVIGARLVSKVAGSRAIGVTPTGCMCVNYGYAGAPLFPYIHSLFPNAGAVLSGIDAGLRALGKRDGVNLFAFAGDGGTVDIGLQSLSGAVERGHRFLYVCYDNEGYMNTGVQRSGATPPGARTATTPAGEGRPFGHRKDMVRMLAGQGIPFAATASIAFPLDLLRKVERALAVDGPSYIHLHSPCGPGWGYPDRLVVQVARLGVQSRVFPLYEVEDGRHYRLTQRAKQVPLEEYLRIQRRFTGLLKPENRDLLETLARDVEASWKYLAELCHLADNV